MYYNFSATAGLHINDVSAADSLSTDVTAPMFLPSTFSYLQLKITHTHIHTLDCHSNIAAVGGLLPSVSQRTKGKHYLKLAWSIP